MQRLKGNSHGFLVGDAVEIGDLVGTWTDMQSDLRAIRKALEGGAGFGGGRVNKSANVQAQIPPQNKRPTDSASIATPSVRGAGGGRVLGGKNGAFSGNYSASNAEKPNKNKVLTAQVASTVNAFTAGQKAQRNAQAQGKRDNKGRFTGNGGGGGADDLGGGFGGGGGGSIKGVVDKLSRTLDSMGNAEQVDPAVKAFNEVAKPMTRGLQGLGILGDGESREEKGRNRWYRRFWGFFKKQQNDTEKHQKEVKKSLKVIEEKPVGKGGGGGGFLSGLIPNALKGLGVFGSGMLGTLFGGALVKGGGVLKALGSNKLMRRLPWIGGLLMSAGGLLDILGSENSDMTRADKDKATGKAGGGILGTLAGMWGGAKAGALAGGAVGSLFSPAGTAVGASLGGIVGGLAGAWLGQEAGAIIGEQVGTYARSAFAAVKASSGYLWDEATSVFDGVGDKASEVFKAFQAGADSVFADMKGWAKAGTELIGGLTESLNNWIKEKTGYDIGARASELNKQRKEMVSNAWEATKSKASEWGGAAYDWAYGQAASSTMGKAAQKGIDAWNASRAETTSWNGRARDDLVGASLAAGADPALVAQIAHLESGFNADARPIQNGKRLSSAHGYGQFLDDTWTEVVNRHGSKYGVEGAGKLTKAQAQALRNDPALQAAMLAEFTNENVARGRKLGGTNDAANAYAFHNLGAGDATRLLRAMQANPNASVRDVLQSDSSQKEKDRVAKVLANNPSLYGKRGDATVSEAYANMGAKLDAGASYGRDAAKHAQVLKNGAGYGAGALASAGQAGGAVQFPTTAAIPTAGMQAVMPSVAPAPAPELPALLSSNADKQRQTPLIPLVDAGQDISERGIAHIATGGISG